VRWEQTYSVPSLSLPSNGSSAGKDLGSFEAVRLFADRASLVQPDFALRDENAAVVAEICRRLDGIPLAIELAAARVRMLSLDQIRAKLHDRFRLLAGGSKAALPRHQTLRAAIQWSYDHLTPDEQRLLRALSVFAGGWTLEAAVAACGEDADEFEVLDLLTRLVDKSLVVVERLDGGEPRYRFLETVRQFGRDLLIESGEVDASRRRHRDWFLALAERAAPNLNGPEQAAWLNHLEAENDNLRAALDWCLEGDAETEAGLRLTAAMQWFWAIRGYVGEGRERCAAILAKPRPAEPTATLSTVLHGAGNLSFRQDDYPTARGYYQQALAVREQLGDRRGVAGSLGSLGNVAQYQGDYAEALKLFEQSLVINREVGNRVWEATNFTCLGNVSRHLGDFAAARSFLEQAVALNREIGNRNGEASSFDGLGALLLQMGDDAGATSAFEQALAIEREIGSVYDQAVTLSGLGTVAMKQGDPAGARAFHTDALKILHRLGARLQIAACLRGLASLALHQSQPQRSVRLWAAADSLLQSIRAAVPPGEREEQERGIAAARASLGEAAFASTWAEGSQMTLEKAVEHATEASS
jgi:non-specific serine/threonine protein kinase